MHQFTMTVHESPRLRIGFAGAMPTIHSRAHTEETLRDVGMFDVDFLLSPIIKYGKCIGRLPDVGSELRGLIRYCGVRAKFLGFVRA